jgi:hypothetical protein
MTGDKLALEQVAIRPAIPVILCTGSSRKIADATSAQIGIKALAYKPVVKSDLARTDREALDARKSETGYSKNDYRRLRWFQVACFHSSRGPLSSESRPQGLMEKHVVASHDGEVTAQILAQFFG